MITNKWILGNGEISDAILLRRMVFIAEQGIAEEIEMDDLDEQAMHLVIYDDERPVATGRIWHDGKTFRIGRCCVVKDVRGQGVGDLLVKLLILKVFEFNPGEIRVHAQSYASDFYKRFGFAAVGEEFYTDSIPHIPMSLSKDTMVFPSKCGQEKHWADFFEERQ